MNRSIVLEVADRCLSERIERVAKRASSYDVREISLVTQQILFDIYSEARTSGGMGDAEDILRNDNIKAALSRLPARSRALAADVLVCAHALLRPLAD